MDVVGKRSAFIQVITQYDSWHFVFPEDSFRASKSQFSINIGPNIFNTGGVSLNICQNGVTVTGQIEYGPFMATAYDIMGPFRILPFMECNHAVHSLSHTLQGSMLAARQRYDFSGGKGYIEQDWGRSFPTKYAWLQANDFGQDEACLFLSIAKVPFLGCIFTGCICILLIDKKEYRLATYLGVRIMEWSQNSIMLKQGKYTLQISIQGSPGQRLMAPGNGKLCRVIQESPCCRMHVIFYKDNNKLFERSSNCASYEFVE